VVNRIAPKTVKIPRALNRMGSDLRFHGSNEQKKKVPSFCKAGIRGISDPLRHHAKKQE